jgi:predicted secreted acid phosphatase
MPRRHALAALFALAGLAPAGAAAAEPAAPAAPAAIVAYHDSGEWSAAAYAVTARAEAQLATAVRGRPALVLDVDDTSLSSYDCLRRRTFVRSAAAACVRAAHMPAVPQTLALFRAARARGVAVIFLTGRRERLRRATTANLWRAGYGRDWTLMMRPNRERPGRHAGFKARRRRALERHGLRIVANVGDQRSDLTGGAALHTFKLPNPMYLIRTA